MSRQRRPAVRLAAARGAVLARSFLTGLAFGAGLPDDAGAQSKLPEWRLESPDLFTSSRVADLARVRAADVDSSLRVVIADAGNFRILIAAGNTQVRALGRKGAGPGDFSGLDWAEFKADTVVAFDALLNRLSAYSISGTQYYARALPQLGGRQIVALTSHLSNDVLGIAYAITPGDRRGVTLDSVDIVRVAGASTSVIARVPWRYSYTFVEPQASTTYGVPFLGGTRVRSAGGSVVVAPLDQPVVLIFGGDGRPGVVSLPVPAREVRARDVTAHRDSLLRMLGPDPARYPGAKGRIEAAFGPSFPMQGPRSPVESSIACGPLAWFEVGDPVSGRRGLWFVLDVPARRFVASMQAPDGLTLLGCSAGHVVALRETPDGEEEVVVRAIRK